MSRRGTRPPPECGPDSYNAFAYANPIRHVLANILGTQKELASVPADATGDIDADPSGAPRGSARTTSKLKRAHHTHVMFSSRVVEPVESYLYQPMLAAYMAVVTTAKKLQSGRLDAYVGYMLLALVAILIVAAAMG